MTRKFDFILDHENSHALQVIIVTDGARGNRRTPSVWESKETAIVEATQEGTFSSTVDQNFAAKLCNSAER